MPRFERSELFDLEIRTRLQAPSSDCFVRKKWLKYHARVAHSALLVLLGLLQQRGGNGEQLPCVRLVVNNIQVFMRFLPDKLADAPSPTADPFAIWITLSDYAKEWKSTFQ